MNNNANNENKQQEVFLTANYIAKYMQVSRPTVIRWVDEQGLPAIRIGREYRFKKDDFFRWMEKFRLNSTTDQEE
jgi:excisionase family DNA binding protein